MNWQHTQDQSKSIKGQFFGGLVVVHRCKKIFQIWVELALFVDIFKSENCPQIDFYFHKKMTFHDCILILYAS